MRKGVWGGGWRGRPENGRALQPSVARGARSAGCVPLGIRVNRFPLGPREAGALRVMRGGRLGRMVDEEEIVWGEGRQAALGVSLGGERGWLAWLMRKGKFAGSFGVSGCRMRDVWVAGLMIPGERGRLVAPCVAGKRRPSAPPLPALAGLLCPPFSLQKRHSASCSPLPVLHLPGSFATLFPFQAPLAACFLHALPPATPLLLPFLPSPPPFRSSSPLPLLPLPGSVSGFFPPRPHLSSHRAHSTILTLSPRPPIHSASSSPCGPAGFVFSSQVIFYLYIIHYFILYIIVRVGLAHLPIIIITLHPSLHFHHHFITSSKNEPSKTSFNRNFITIS